MSEFLDQVLGRLDVEQWHREVRRATRRQVERVLARRQPRPEDAPALFSLAARDLLEPLARRARAVTLARFGRTVTLYAPLYLSNHCINHCRYCGFAAGRDIERRSLSLDEAERQAAILVEQGIRHVLLLTGEHPARYGLDERPYVLSVGTVQPRKNYVRLIKAFAQLRASRLQLVIAGGMGWLYQDILAEAEKHAGSVRLLGFVDDGDLPALYRNASLLAFPSLYEGFGLPVLEAMACGVPVICSDVSSLPEVAGDAALLVDPLATAGLTEALARVLEDAGLRRQMISNGLAQAARFTWEQAARQLLGSFDALAHGSRIERRAGASRD